MDEDERPSFILAANGDSTLGRVSVRNEATETIDVNALFAPDLSESGSFDISDVSHSMFAKLLQAMSVPTLLVSRSHEITFANSAFMKTIRDSVDLKGSTFSSIFPNPREARQAQLLLEKVFEQRRPEVRESVLQIRRMRLWARIHLRTIRLGSERMVLVQIENLTAQKRLLSIQKYKKLVKIFPIGIAEFALPRELDCSAPVDRLLSSVLDARIVDGNDEFASLYKRRSISELAGTRLGVLLPFTDKSESLYRHWIQAQFPIRQFETRELDTSDNERFFENTLIGDVGNKRIAGLWWLKADVSQKKKAAEEIVRSKKIESLGILAGGIAHDFNNLLTGILGNISLAQTYLTPDHKAYDRLEAAARASKRSQELTHQLLTFSKGGLPVKQRACIAELIGDSTEFILRGSNVRSEVTIPGDLWNVHIDSGQVNQVFCNLLINAVQAMPGGGTVFVVAENCLIESHSMIPLTPGKYVRMLIRDQGVGIPPENLQKIFDPYFTTKAAGSGLGLATAYSIIKNHDGLITVGSEVGVGTVFSIYLQAVPAAAAAVSAPRNGAPIRNCPGRILVMDDEQVIRDLAAELLSSMGYDVGLAEDGIEAVDVYRKACLSGQPYDAVILDLTIRGGMGGQETLEQLRRIDPQIRAIVSSGYSNDPVMAEFGKYGFVGVLRKPYAAEEVGKQLKSVLAGVTEGTHVHLTAEE